jgi:DNA polymerase delta subunit 4
MPTKRRTSGLATKAQQSTLAFHGSTNRVTKPTRVSNGKKPVIPEGVAKCTKPDVVDIDALEESKLTTVEADVIFQVEKDIAAESTPEEEEAKQITETAIKKYWATKERQRLAPRVHQQDLSVHQKILREFDVSGQYGVSALDNDVLWHARSINVADPVCHS